MVSEETRRSAYHQNWTHEDDARAIITKMLSCSDRAEWVPILVRALASARADERRRAVVAAREVQALCMRVNDETSARVASNIALGIEMLPPQDSERATPPHAGMEKPRCPCRPNGEWHCVREIDHNGSESAWFGKHLMARVGSDIPTHGWDGHDRPYPLEGVSEKPTCARCGGTGVELPCPDCAGGKEGK